MKRIIGLLLILFTVAMARDALPDECKVRAQTRVYIEITALDLDPVDTACTAFEGRIRGRNLIDEWGNTHIPSWRVRTFHLPAGVPVYNCKTGECVLSGTWADYPLRTWVVMDVVKMRMVANGQMKSYWIPATIFIPPDSFWGKLPEN